MQTKDITEVVVHVDGILPGNLGLTTNFKEVHSCLEHTIASPVIS